MPAADDPQPRATVVVGIVGVILLLAIVLLTQVIFYNVQRIEDQAKLYQAPRPSAPLQAEQLAQISSYRWINEKEGVVAIPIDRAIELYVQRMKTGGAPPTMQAPGREPRENDPTPDSAP